MKKTAVSRKKPHRDFPLFLHATGQWAKKVRGKMHYFGKDRDAALDKWLAEKDELLAGRTPRLHRDGLTVADLANRFLTAKKALLATGELSPVTWRCYFTACERIVGAFRGGALVADLTPADFAALRTLLATTLGPVALGVEIQRIRTVFRWAFVNELIDKPVRFGASFDKPSRKLLRQARHESGSRMLEAEELRTLLEAASPALKAMVLLGLNCGYGQSDVANLPAAALDLKGGWVNYPRPKTSIARRCPLWPETVDALKAAIASRPEPKNESDDRLVFLTKYGKPWVRMREQEGKAGVLIDSVRLEFGKMLQDAKLKRKGLGFYALRHVFRTVADSAKDGPAIDLIMGHVDSSMGDRYRERIDDDRLKAVTNHVRNWLYGK